MSKQSKPGDGSMGKGIRRSRHPEFDSLFETERNALRTEHKNDDKSDKDSVNETADTEM